MVDPKIMEITRVVPKGTEEPHTRRVLVNNKDTTRARRAIYLRELDPSS